MMIFQKNIDRNIRRVQNILQSKFILPAILAGNFLLRLVILGFTNLYYFNDYKAGLEAIEIIRDTGYHPLRIGRFLAMNAHIGFFFKYILGNITWYFVFNCLLATLSIFLIYLFVKELWGDKKTAVLTALMLSLYSEFSALSALFYTQVIEICLFSLMLLLLTKLYKAHKISHIIFLIVCISMTVNLSFFFKSTLKYLWIALLLFSIFQIFLNKNYLGALKFSLLSITIIAVTLLMAHAHTDVGYMLSSEDKTNHFIFFGHTMYGGDGGEGSFVYPENEKLYLKKYQEFLERHGIDNPSLQTMNDFQAEEIKKFMLNHPLQWIRLQYIKFARTFGIIPEGNTFKILITGIFRGNWVLTALFLQLPFLSFILLFTLLFNPGAFSHSFNRTFFFLYIMLCLYWLAGTVFYGCSQERYRMPIMACFIIPCLAYFMVHFKPRAFLKNRKILLIKIFFVVLITGIWAGQAYNALVVHKDRYFGLVEKAHSGEIK